MGHRKIRGVGEPLADLDTGTFAAIERAVVKSEVRAKRDRAAAERKKKRGGADE